MDKNRNMEDLSFWREVKERVWKRIKGKYFTIGGWFHSILFFLLGLVVLYILNENEATSYLYSLIPPFFPNLTCILCWFFSEVPQEIYQEQFKKIKDLSHRLFEEIDISIEPVVRHDNNYASLRVMNKNKVNTIFCQPFLEQGLYEYNQTTEINILNNNKIYKKELSWDGGGKEVEIKPGKDDHVNIARLAGNQLLFCFSDSDKPFSLGTYKVWVDILCRRDSTQKIYRTEYFLGYITAHIISGTLSSGIEIQKCQNEDKWMKEAEARKNRSESSANSKI